MIEKKLLVGLSTLTILALAGCNGSASVGGEGETVLIGGLSPLTGDGASYGIESQRSAELALADVNVAWADKGMELDIQWEDGACNGGDASTATQKLVDVNKVQVILGGFCSSETLAAAAITEPAGVLLFSPASSSPDVTNAGDYVFRNWPSDAFQGQKMAELAGQLGYKKVGLITEQQDYTFGISKVFKEKFKGEVVEETYLSEDTDFKTQLTKLNNAGVDVMFVNAQTPIKGNVIIKQMQELGVKGPFLMNDAVGTSSDVLTPYAEYLEGSYTATVNIDQASASFTDFKGKYTTAHGEDMALPVYDAASYDAVWILANAIAAVGNNADAIKDYLNDFPGYKGLMGDTDFDANGDPLTGHSIFKVMNGELMVQ